MSFWESLDILDLLSAFVLSNKKAKSVFGFRIFLPEKRILHSYLLMQEYKLLDELECCVHNSYLGYIVCTVISCGKCL